MNRQGVWVVVVLAVLTAVTVWFALLIYPRSSAVAFGPIGDEAVLSQGAVRVAQGQVPNRDFISIVGGASYYPLAAAFRIFGDSYQVVRTFNFLNALLIVVLTLWVLWPYSRSTALAGVVSFSALFFPLWPYASYHWMFLAVLLLAVGCLVRIQSWRGAVVAGAALGLASFSVFQKALPVAGGLLVYLFFFSSPSSDRLKRTLAYCGGFGGSIAAAIAVMWSNGSLQPFLQQVLIDNVRYYHEAIPGLYFALNSVFVMLVVFLIAAWLPMYLYRKNSAVPMPVHQAFWWAGFGAAISTLYYLEVVHLSYAMLPIVIAFALAFNNFLAATKRGLLFVSVTRPAWRIAIVSFVVFAVCFVVYGRDVVIRAYDPAAFGPVRSRIAIETARGTLYGNSQWLGTFADLWNAVEAAAKPRQGQRIFFLPYCPGCYYFHNIDNPTPLDFLVTDRMSPENEAWLKRSLLDNTDVVVFIPPSWGGFPKDGELMQWIRTVFPLQASYYDGQIVVMKKD